ncbi:unnamed protein product [Adineta steineri]|uniref:P2X purinoceptor n=1 Tax=Adineta steineri TaxID=433720 RepID=A0A815EWM8_9BILA|nr:unnamed protein product [Adineta steineri]
MGSRKKTKTKQYHYFPLSFILFYKQHSVIMSESVCDKLQQHCALIAYAFSPSHIKDVVVGMATTYETPKIMTINSYPIAITCRFVQLLIFIYAFAYVLWYKRGYQDRDQSLLSSVTLEVNGIGFHENNSTIMFDNADFIVPPQESNALFIMTNLIQTDQQRKRCEEGIDIDDAQCTNHSQCEERSQYRERSNGRWTGKCRLLENRCEIEGWCPVENDLIIPKPIMGTLNYTILLKNFIEFARFNITRRNIFNESKYFQTCRYHPIHDRWCPTFRIDDLLHLVENDEEERHDMLARGAVLRIKIDWMCNLDLGENECKPLYSFGRLNPRSSDESFSVGFNFRYASHWRINNKSYRTLTKAYGLRFIVTVTGDAGRFSFFVLTLNIGSIVGVLSLATFICDIVALYCSEQGYIYRRQKFQSVHLKNRLISSTVTISSSVHKRKMARRIKRRR